MTEEEVREELRPGSEQRLKESLILMEIANKEKIQVDQVEVQQHLEHTISSLISGMSEREARRTISDDVLRGLTANVYNNTLIGNTLKHLRAMATGELENQEKELSEAEVKSEKPKAKKKSKAKAKKTSEEKSPSEDKIAEDAAPALEAVEETSEAVMDKAEESTPETPE
ncbi:MAG: hypothetical protein HC806_07600 [Anaerolineae bacterium]|nr:hypothetical protein [Anaerolineae bacterium]